VLAILPWNCIPIECEMVARCCLHLQRKLESTVSDLQRSNDRLKEKVAVLTAKVSKMLREHV